MEIADLNFLASAHKNADNLARRLQLWRHFGSSLFLVVWQLQSDFLACCFWQAACCVPKFDGSCNAAFHVVGNGVRCIHELLKIQSCLDEPECMVGIVCQATANFDNFLHF
jgi:hypothetical protein